MVCTPYYISGRGMGLLAVGSTCLFPVNVSRLRRVPRPPARRSPFTNELFKPGIKKFLCPIAIMTIDVSCSTDNHSLSLGNM
jgi:hypothetical protein